jgi:hypothetical protein
MDPNTLIYDTTLPGRVILALQRAITATFILGDWQELSGLRGVRRQSSRTSKSERA